MHGKKIKKLLILKFPIISKEKLKTPHNEAQDN